jgi:predicted dehydrogenase
MSRFPVPVRVALIGCGQIGRLHAKRLADDSRARITALIDPVAASREALQTEFAPDAMLFAALEDLPTGAGIDAVVLCTPTGQHFRQVRALRARGWPVLCEKPLADTRDRIVQLIEESASGPLLSLAYQRRYWPTFRTLRREIHSGRWGAVRAVTVTAMERWQPTIPGTWRDDPHANPGGFVADAGSHKIDMLFFLTGLSPSEATPLQVVGFTHNRGCRVPIVATMCGRLGTVDLSMTFVGDAQHLREDVHVHCEQADLLLRNNSLWIARDNHHKPMIDLEPESDPNRAFLDCLVDGAPNLAPATCALPVWDLTQAILDPAASR